MYTIEKRSYGVQVTVDSALEPHEIDMLAVELKRNLKQNKKPYEPLGIFVRSGSNALGTLKPRMYVVE